MSRDNVALVRAAQEALAAGDVETALGYLDADIEWHGTVGGLDEGAIYRGRDEVVQAFLAYFETWERLELRAERYVDTPGDDVVVFFHEVARGRESGAVVETDTGTVNTVRDGKIVRVRGFMDRDQALRVAGVAAADESGDNVALIRRMYDAVARRDSVVPFELYAEDIVWDYSSSRVATMYSRPVYHGHEGVREAWREGLTAFKEVEMRLEEATSLDAHQVLAVVGENHVGRASGAPVRSRHFALWTIAGGRIVRLRIFDDRAAAEEAAGNRDLS